MHSLVIATTFAFSTFTRSTLAFLDLISIGMFMRTFVIATTFAFSTFTRSTLAFHLCGQHIAIGPVTDSERVILGTSDRSCNQSQKESRTENGSNWFDTLVY